MPLQPKRLLTETYSIDTAHRRKQQRVAHRWAAAVSLSGLSIFGSFAHRLFVPRVFSAGTLSLTIGPHQVDGAIGAFLVAAVA